MTVEVAFDGGCRNNPNGAASSGAVVRAVDGRTLRHVGRAIGVGSNNLAEWTGLLIGLEAARDLGATAVRAFGDSQLVVEQFKGNYAIREERLRAVAMDVSAVARTFAEGVTIAHVPRERNRAADAICTAVLEGTYVPDADLLDPAEVPPPVARDVEVSFIVQVRMDRVLADEQLRDGVPITKLRKTLAANVERKLILAGSVGEYTVTPSRVKG